MDYRSDISREQVIENEYLYTEKCNCGKEMRLYAQEDDDYPEYYNDVWVECGQCGQLVYFELPVN